jgi:5'-phosphate synthase pdxT subunit
MLKKIGVLALQGAFIEHVQMIHALGVEAAEVRLPEHLEQIDGLIIPGGESTTMGKLADAYRLIEPIRSMAHAGTPIWGTCAGMILLATDVGAEQPILGLMDIVVSRNAFGRQVDSFETDITVPALDAVSTDVERGRAFRAIFIRAPYIQSMRTGVKEIGRLPNGPVVAARQGNLLVTAFHPELGDDTRFHRYFLALDQSRPQRFRT